jgi:hypothetical protein
MIRKGTLLKVSHQGKGVFFAISENDFDEKTDEFFPVIFLGYAGGFALSDSDCVSLLVPRALCKITVVK